MRTFEEAAPRDNSPFPPAADTIRSTTPADRSAPLNIEQIMSLLTHSHFYLFSDEEVVSAMK